MKRPLIVELVGPAGAGKSTLAGQLRRRDASVCGDLSLWGLPRLQLLASAIRLVPTVLGALLSGRPLRWGEVTQMIRLDALHREVERARRNYPIILLDEGPVFALSWLDQFYARNGRDRAFGSWRRRALSHWAALLDIVVLLDAGDPDLVDRIRARPKPHPVKDWPDAAIRQFTAAFRRSFERVIADFLAAGTLTLATLDTGATPIDQHADRLIASLQQASHGN